MTDRRESRRLCYDGRTFSLHGRGPLVLLDGTTLKISAELFYIPIIFRLRGNVSILMGVISSITHVPHRDMFGMISFILYVVHF